MPQKQRCRLTTSAQSTKSILALKSSFKSWDMPLGVACTRYSLVKGERIVRFAQTTQLLPGVTFQPGIYTRRMEFFWQ